MGMKGRIWTSTPLRLSLAIVGLFTLANIGSFTATYAFVRDNTEDTLRATLEQEMSGFRALPNQAAVMTLVRSQSRGSSPDERILSYRMPGGLTVGNAALLPGDAGYSAVSFDKNVPDIDGTYFALGEMVHGGLLTIAVNAEPLDKVGEAFFAIFLFSIIPTTVIAVGGGLILARRSARRLDRIDDTLDQLTQGDYSARVNPVAGRTDDLSLISTRIDRMAEAQEKQIAALRQVSADIAHDLKTPIQRVSVLLDQLRKRDELSGEAAEIVDQTSAQTEGIVRTFQSLLQIAQIEGGSPKSRFEPVDLTQLVETFCEVYEPAAEESGHLLVASVPDEPVLINGDKTLFGQVLANLVENALRHTPSGSEISVRVAVTDAGIPRVIVADNGPGIPEAERENVLRRLYRLERSRTTPGSGLGLSLVAAVVEMHDGTLSLEDNAPGLRVVISLRPAS